MFKYDHTCLVICSWANVFGSYFQKGALMGQKGALNLKYVDTRQN